jgi:hypothetical protein
VLEVDLMCANAARSCTVPNGTGVYMSFLQMVRSIRFKCKWFGVSFVALPIGSISS